MGMNTKTNRNNNLNVNQNKSVAAEQKLKHLTHVNVTKTPKSPLSMLVAYYAVISINIL